MSIEDYKNLILKINISDDKGYPKSFLYGNFYPNLLRLGLIMSELTNNKKVKTTISLLRILLNLYNSSKTIKKICILMEFDIKKYIPLKNNNPPITISTFNELIGFLYSKGLINDNIDSKLNTIVLQLTDEFKSIILDFPKELYEPNLEIRISFIRDIFKLWYWEDFINFIKKEMRELL